MGCFFVWFLTANLPDIGSPTIPVARWNTKTLKPSQPSSRPFNPRRSRGLLFILHFVLFWHNSPQWARASSFTRFLDHTKRHTRIGRILVISSSQRPLPDNQQHSQQKSMPPVGFEPTTPASERPQTYASGRADPGTGEQQFIASLNNTLKKTKSLAELPLRLLRDLYPRAC